MYLFSNSIIFCFFLIHLILLVIGFTIAYSQAKKIDLLGIVIVVIVYLLLNFSRTGFGVDEPTYLEAYRDYLHDGTVHFEYSFNFLYFVFSKAGVTSGFFNYAFSTLFIFLSSVVVIKCTRKPYQTLALVFFLFFSVTLDFIFNAYRQGMAFLFVILYLHYYYQGERKKALLLLITALGFHWSSIVVFFAVILCRVISIRNAVRMNLVILGITLIAAVIPLRIISVIGNVLSAVSFGSPSVLKNMKYLESPIAYFYDLNLLGRMPLIVVVVFMLVMVFLYRQVIPQFYYKLVILLMSYCLIFLEMSYSFRNYYWVLPILPFLMANIPSYLPTPKQQRSAIVAMSFFHLVLAITGYYTSGIMSLIFV